MRISDWSSDVCSSDLTVNETGVVAQIPACLQAITVEHQQPRLTQRIVEDMRLAKEHADDARMRGQATRALARDQAGAAIAAAGHIQRLTLGVEEIGKGSGRERGGPEG